MFTLPLSSTDACRTITVPLCEIPPDTSQSAPVPAMTLFYLRLRDALDYTVDFGPWLAAYGAGKLASAVWTVATTSPKIPTIVNAGFDPTGLTAAVIAPGAGAIPGDAYWVDLTVTTAPIPLSGSNLLALPARTLVRRVNFVVVNG